MFTKLKFIIATILISSNILVGQNIIRINIEEKVSDLENTLNYSQFINKIEYIPLESKAECIIDRNPEISIADQYIIVRTLNDCFLFDKLNGKFIRKIGQKGKGPQEYRSTQGFVNAQNKRIYFSGWKGNLLEYDFQGKFIKSINIPEYRDDFKSPSVPTNFTYLNKYIVSYFSNCIGQEQKKVSIFDMNGIIIKIWPNTNIYTQKRFTLTTKESVFYHYQTNLFFKENYNDTIFQITDKKIVPHLVLFTGKYLKPYESKWWNMDKIKGSDFITPFDINESKAFIYFKFYFKQKLLVGIFDKIHNNTKIVSSTNLINDIDNFYTFVPFSSASENELLGYADAYLISEWFSNNADKSIHLNQKVQKLKKIKESDNPVVMIAKFKE